MYEDEETDTLTVGGMCKRCGDGSIVDEDGLCLDCRSNRHRGPSASKPSYLP